MMTKTRIFVLMLLAPIVGIQAQQKLTLEQCVQYALENHEVIKNAEIDAQIAKDKVKETTTIGLPQVNGKIDVINNTDIQKQFLPANVFNPSAPSDVIVPVGFGIQYSAKADITISQLIFDGSYLVGLKAAKAYKDFAETSIKRSQVDVVEQVSKAYYAWIVNDSRLQLLETNKQQLDQLYKDTKVMVDNGVAEKVDLQRIEVSVNDIQTNIQKIKNAAIISEFLLKMQMGMPTSDTIEAAQTLDNFETELVKTGDVAYNIDDRIEYNMLTKQLALQDLKVANERIKAYPTVAAFGSFGWNYGHNQFGDLIKLKNWENYSLIGLTVKVPIFSSFRRKFRINQTLGEYQKVQNQMNLMQKRIDVEVQTSKLAYENSLKALDVQKKNMELADEVYRITKIKYQEGIVTNFEVVQAESALQKTQSNYYESMYNAFISKVSLEKAKGTLIK